MSDLAATFDAHVQAEFQDLDLEATMATMMDDPYVHHVPTITGGNGTASCVLARRCAQVNSMS